MGTESKRIAVVDSLEGHASYIRDVIRTKYPGADVNIFPDESEFLKEEGLGNGLYFDAVLIYNTEPDGAGNHIASGNLAKHIKEHGFANDVLLINYPSGTDEYKQLNDMDVRIFSFWGKDNYFDTLDACLRG